MLIAEVGAAIGELREITQELRPRFLERLKLYEAIRFHCIELEKRSGTRIRCLAKEAPYSLGERVKVQCFLSFREALSHALKHSSATQIDVTLVPEAPGFLTVCITDNGGGFDPAQALGRPVGLGLLYDRRTCRECRRACRDPQPPGKRDPGPHDGPVE